MLFCILNITGFDELIWRSQAQSSSEAGQRRQLAEVSNRNRVIVGKLRQTSSPDLELLTQLPAPSTSQRTINSQGSNHEQKSRRTRERRSPEAAGSSCSPVAAEPRAPPGSSQRLPDVQKLPSTKLRAIPFKGPLCP